MQQMVRYSMCTCVFVSVCVRDLTDRHRLMLVCGLDLRCVIISDPLLCFRDPRPWDLTYNPRRDSCESSAGPKSPRGWDPLLGCKDMGHTQINTRAPAAFVAYFTPHLLLLLLANGKSRSGWGWWRESLTAWKIQLNVHSPCIFSWNDVSHVWPLIWRDIGRADLQSPHGPAVFCFLQRKQDDSHLRRSVSGNRRISMQCAQRKSRGRVHSTGAVYPSPALSRNARYAQLRCRYLKDTLSVWGVCTGCSRINKACSSSCKGQQY